MSELRSLVLVNATGASLRTAMFEERPHLVFPLVALIGDEVVHAVNSETPELVPAEEIARGFFSFCGRPVVGNHPQVNGRYVSANPVSVAEKHAFGRIDNPRFVDNKLVLDAWIDRARAEKLGGDALSALRRAEAGEPIEVSVGIEVEVEQRSGTAKNGKKYVGIWRELAGDHVALLPEGSKGACSIAMGCGAPRAAMRHMVSAEGLSLVDAPAVTATTVTPSATTVHEKSPPPSSSKERAVAELRAADKDEHGYGSYKRGEGPDGGDASGGDHHTAESAVKKYDSLTKPQMAKLEKAKPDAFKTGQRDGSLSGQSIKSHLDDVNNWDDKQAADAYIAGFKDGKNPPKYSAHYRSSSSQESTMTIKDRLKSLLTKLTLVDAGDPPPGEEAAELIGYQTIRTLLDQLSVSAGEATVLVDAMIAAEANPPAEGEQAEETVETAQLEAINALCFSMMSICSSITNACSAMLYEPPMPPDAPGYYEYMRAAAGKRHSNKDQQMLQTVHDHSVALGAYCDPKMKATQEAEPKAASCGCPKAPNSVEDAKETEMEPDPKVEERVTALITNDKTPFTEADRPSLRAAAGTGLLAHLEKIAAQGTSTAVATVVTEPPPGTVNLREDEVKALRAAAARELAREEVRKGELIKQLKDAQQTAYSEDELKALSLDGLERAVKLVGLAARPRDFSGRVVPSLVPENEQKVAPPPSMEKTARAMRGLADPS